jgi:pimeloyl-ACP methyl ester carboxylesterase
MTYQMAVARKDKVTYAQFSQDVDTRNLRITQQIFEYSLADLPGNYREVDLQLHRTRAPILVVWGDKDPFFALAVGQRTAKSAPDGVMRTIQGAGHFPPLEDPHAFASSVLERFGAGLVAYRHEAHW